MKILDLTEQLTIDDCSREYDDPSSMYVLFKIRHVQYRIAVPIHIEISEQAGYVNRGLDMIERMRAYQFSDDDRIKIAKVIIQMLDDKLVQNDVKKS